MTCFFLKNDFCDKMIIGFIGFGKVSKNLFNLISSDEITFITSSQNRSKKTVENIQKENIHVLDTFRDVALKSDILISANSPKNACSAAIEYGKYCSGIYLDLNNVSPNTIMEIDRHVNSLVDGAVIGKIDLKKPNLYLSGEKAEELLFLDEFLNVKVISDKAGDASKLKLLRSTFTKTLSALLIESYDLSEKYDLADEFLEALSLTEGDDFKDKSLSRIGNTKNSYKRKSEELGEILDYFGSDLDMVSAAYSKFSRY